MELAKTRNMANEIRELYERILLAEEVPPSYEFVAAQIGTDKQNVHGALQRKPDLLKRVNEAKQAAKDKEKAENKPPVVLSTVERIRIRVREILGSKDEPMPTQEELAFELGTVQAMVSFALKELNFAEFSSYQERSRMTNIVSCKIRQEAINLIDGHLEFPRTYVEWAKKHNCDSGIVSYAVRTLPKRYKKKVEAGMRKQADRSVSKQTQQIAVRIITQGRIPTLLEIARLIWHEQDWEANETLRKKRLKAVRTGLARLPEPVLAKLNKLKDR